MPTVFSDELQIGSGTFNLGKGALNTAALSGGDQIGTTTFHNTVSGSTSEIPIFYIGLEESEQGPTAEETVVRHVLHASVRYRPTKTPLLWLYASEVDGDVILEMDNENANGGGFKTGVECDIEFSHGLFIPGTASPETEAELRSIRWNVIPGTELSN